jgi:hypothetical protein
MIYVIGIYASRKPGARSSDLVITNVRESDEDDTYIDEKDGDLITHIGIAKHIMLQN